MSSDEDFLSRWSRRKRAGGEVSRPPEKAVEPTLPSSPCEVDAATTETKDASQQEEFDLAALPPIESIVEGTDISAFLKRGVPLDLTRAALRRAWSTDPTIRDFIGLAENAWDFNDPKAMPGFGPLDQSPEEVRQMLARVMGEVRQNAKAAFLSDDTNLVTQPQKDFEVTTETTDIACPTVKKPALENAFDPDEKPDKLASQQRPVDVAMPQEQVPDSVERPMVRRTHGGALPH